MRILFVAMADSIHTARWIRQVAGRGWDVHLFPVSQLAAIHPDLREVTVYSHSRSLPQGAHSSLKVKTFWGLPFGSGTLSQVASQCWPTLLDPSRWLTRVIRQLQPDVLHSLEFQHAGYLALRARSLFRGSFPPWIVTNGGSDVSLYARLPEHLGKVRALLQECDFYWCECQRDVPLARNLGLRGQVLPVQPRAGGFDLERTSRLRSEGLTSARRWIFLKGSQNGTGRALVGLRALAQCSTALRDYQIVVCTASGDVALAAELLTASTGLSVKVVPTCSHDESLRWLGQARIYLGLSISGSICSSLLEAMVMGAFPIQTDTSCSDEWIIPGQTGLLVSPEDPTAVAAALRQALADDDLVDQAVCHNDQVVKQRLDWQALASQAAAVYEQVAALGKTPSCGFFVGDASSTRAPALLENGKAHLKQERKSTAQQQNPD